jgi:hypothetical protein
MLPDAVFSHPKSGFTIPMHAFQNAAYAALSRELLDPARDIMQLFDHGEVEHVRTAALAQRWDRAESSAENATNRLWALMQLAAWQHRFRVAL